ncbi:hypothetical protein [Anaeroselena agilis]|uniref:Uncharacterized protein n=1 Tax=Anaeroselena agilis TaxID=3063788 RepID=A0ABU3NWI8_9FIRM|nr:hypothetical protein [Selenomonadales bacterium 4137-cl]
MITFLKSLLYEYGEPSLTRLLTLYSWLLCQWAIHQAFYSGKVFTPEQWQILYALITGSLGGGIGLPMANKFYNSRYNTPQSGYMTKAGGGYSDNLRQ